MSLIKDYTVQWRGRETVVQARVQGRKISVYSLHFKTDPVFSKGRWTDTRAIETYSAEDLEEDLKDGKPVSRALMALAPEERDELIELVAKAAGVA